VSLAVFPSEEPSLISSLDSVGLFLYIVPYIGYKIIKKTKYVRSADADLFSGRLRPEEEFEEKPSTSVAGRVFDRLF
jgi:amino acid transporter